MTIRSEGLINQYRASLYAQAQYAQGIEALEKSGILEVLRELGRVAQVRSEHTNYVEAQAAAANQSLGYNTALDYLMHFPEMFLASHTQRTPIADFAALDAAVASGDLTVEEADAIRNDKPVPKLAAHTRASYKLSSTGAVPS